MDQRRPPAHQPRTQHAHDATGNDLTNSPNVIGKLNLSVPLPWQSLRLGTEAQWLAARKTHAGTVPTTASPTSPCCAPWPGNHWEWSASVHNLFDNRYFDATAYDPTVPQRDRLAQDGRSYRLKAGTASDGSPRHDCPLPPPRRAPGSWALLALASQFAPAALEIAEENAVKAAFIYNFASSPNGRTTRGAAIAPAAHLRHRQRQRPHRGRRGPESNPGARQGGGCASPAPMKAASATSWSSPAAPARSRCSSRWAARRCSRSANPTASPALAA